MSPNNTLWSGDANNNDNNIDNNNDSYYLRGCMPARKRTRIRQVRWCAGYVIRPRKCRPCRGWLYCPCTEQVRYPTLRSLEDTFLRGSARPRPCKLSATLVLATETEASVRGEQCASILGCPSICSATRSQGHPTASFGKISARKAIWDLEFSEHLL